MIEVNKKWILRIIRDKILHTIPGVRTKLDSDILADDSDLNKPTIFHIIVMNNSLTGSHA